MKNNEIKRLEKEKDHIKKVLLFFVQQFRK